ncbi:MAG TPA: DUF427 domain-containing protein [Candidatus Limnocylindria bacterium]
MNRSTPVRRVEPGPGQESAWDYPRPPRVERSSRLVRVEFAGRVVAESSQALRVLETAGAPVWYIPRDDVRTELLIPTPRRTFCEWKGAAHYLDVRVGDRIAAAAAWSYPQPSPGYEAIRDHVAFYAGRVDAAYVDGERVTPQPGRFYGGWVTSDVVGPFKGDPGSEGW